MDQPGNEFGGWVQSLIAKSLQDQIATIQRYGELLKRASRGEPDEKAVRDAYTQFVQTQSSVFVRELTALTLNYYERLQALSRNYNNLFFERVMGDPEADGHPGPAAEVQRLDMQLTGPSGGEVTGLFVIENKRTQPAEVSFNISEFLPPGGTPFRPPLEILPARFSVPPMAEQVVRLLLPLIPDQFPPGGPYRALIQVEGHMQLEVALSVTVVEPNPPPAPPSAPAAAAPARKAPVRKASTKVPAKVPAKTGTPKTAKSTPASRPPRPTGSDA